MEQYSVIIIGSGFGGQCTAINLKKMGIHDFLILERRDFMGGTWCQNTYPGAAVDVESALYSIAAEPYDWTQLFADQKELQDYTEHVIKKYGLSEKTHLKTNVLRVEWNDNFKRWIISTDTEKTYQCQFLINATGPLSTPKIPDFKGKNSFSGVSFHTNDWDHEFDYTNKRVAIIGSGASAAQVIPELAKTVNQLHVFQRTPHWVMARGDHKFSQWQRRLLRKKPIYRAFRTLLYWKLESRVIGFKYSTWALEHLAQTKAYEHLSAQVKDFDLRVKLTPDFTIGCKRVILSDTLYPALCQQNVTLHDRRDGIAHIAKAGIVTASGKKLALDAIIYATGFDATDGLISYPVIGKHGKELHEYWNPYPRAYLGTAVPSFPNFFIVTGPNTGIGHTSALFVIESQMQYIMNSIKRVNNTGKRTIEVTAAAEENYTQLIHKEMEKTVWKKGGCNSWYKSKSGHVIAMFPGFSFTFRRWTRIFKKEDHLLA